MPLPPFIPLPEGALARYRIFRAILYLAVALFVLIMAMKALFPLESFSFDFRNPHASRNSLLDPRTPDGQDLNNGRLEADGTLIANASSTGDFSRVRMTLAVEKDSAVPETLTFSLRRSYRDFWLPDGEAIASFPSETLYVVDGTYYALRDGILHPFVSENAYRTRYLPEQAQSAGTDLLSRYPVSDKWLGFRVGTFVAYADGVFLIASEDEIRPIVSAETFLAMGYRFDDVRPATAEEIGIYARGKLFTLGQPHPDGTVFEDADSGTLYLIQNGHRHPIQDSHYHDFLAAQAHPILASAKASEVSVSCTMKPGFLGRSLSCFLPLADLRPGYGNDFETRLSGGDADIDMRSALVSFETEKSLKNVFLLGSQIKQRILMRFGYAAP